MRFLLTLLLVFGSPAVFAIDLDGHTDFAQRLDLNSSVSARVDSIAVSVGQRISRGDLLLTLETARLQAITDQARAEAEVFAPRVSKMQTELEKAQELFDRDSLALVELQNAEQNYASAQAKLEAARAQLRLAQYNLSQASIRAPISGVVLAIQARPGQYINTRVGDSTLIELADNNSMLVNALLPLEQWGENLLNRKASMIFRKQKFEGRVVGIGNQVTRGDNNHPAINLQIKFATNGTIPAGLPVSVSIADE